MKTKAIFFALSFLLLISTKFSAQSCYTGNIYFSTQQQINEFSTKAFTCILGNVTISGNKINNLEALTHLKSIEGYLHISRNRALKDLKGLNNLMTISDGLSLQDVDALNNFEGLNNLVSIGGDFDVKFNRNLENFIGLEKITAIGGNVTISDNPNFINFEGLENLSSIGKDLYVYLNERLTDFEALENLTSIGGTLFIGFNNALTSLKGLDNIDPKTINNLYLQNAANLSTCEINAVCSYLSNPNNQATIKDNATNCNSRKTISSNCYKNESQTTEFSQSTNNNIIILNNYPNPFRKSTVIGFSLETAQNVTLTIYDRQGKLVKQWANELKDSGNHHVEWDAQNDSGELVPTGIYYFQVRTDTSVETIAMIRMD